MLHHHAKTPQKVTQVKKPSKHKIKCKPTRPPPHHSQHRTVSDFPPLPVFSFTETQTEDMSTYSLPIRKLFKQRVIHWPIDQVLNGNNDNNNFTILDLYAQIQQTAHTEFEQQKRLNLQFDPSDLSNIVIFRPLFPTNPINNLKDVGEISLPPHHLLSTTQCDEISTILSQSLIHNKFFTKNHFSTGEIYDQMVVYNELNRSRVYGDIIDVFKIMSSMSTSFDDTHNNHDTISNTVNGTDDASSYAPYYLLQGSYDNLRLLNTSIKSHINQTYVNNNTLSYDFLLHLFNLEDGATPKKSVKKAMNAGLYELLKQRFNSLLSSYILSRILIATDCSYNFIHINTDKHPKIPFQQTFQKVLETTAINGYTYLPSATPFIPDGSPLPKTFFQSKKHQEYARKVYDDNYRLNNPQFKQYTINHGAFNHIATGKQTKHHYPMLPLTIASIPTQTTPYINLFPLPLVQSVIASNSSNSFAIPSPKTQQLEYNPSEQNREDQIVLSSAFNIFTPTRLDYVHLFNKHMQLYINNFMLSALERGSSKLLPKISTDEGNQRINDLNVLEIGIGTGALSISLIDSYITYLIHHTQKNAFNTRPNLRLVGTEVNERALNLCNYNINNYLEQKKGDLSANMTSTVTKKIDISLLFSNLYNNHEFERCKSQFDVIFFNVPWLPFAPRDSFDSDKIDNNKVMTFKGNARGENDQNRGINTKIIDKSIKNTRNNTIGSIDAAVYDSQFSTLHEFLRQSKQYLKTQTTSTSLTTSRSLRSDVSSEEAFQAIYADNTPISQKRHHHIKPQIWLVISTLFMDLGFMDHLPNINALREEYEITEPRIPSKLAKLSPPPHAIKRTENKMARKRLIGHFDDDIVGNVASKNHSVYKQNPGTVTNLELFNYYIEKTSGCKIVEILSSKSHNNQNEPLSPPRNHGGKGFKNKTKSESKTPLQIIRENENVLLYVLEPKDDEY